MSQELILNWLEQLSESVKQHDLDAHMALVSKKVRVYGLPSNNIVNYQGWKKRRGNEFERNLLASLSFSNLNIKTITLRRFGFQVTETMLATNGKSLSIDKEIILELEDDEQWRVVEETIKKWQRD